jgi:hypothetical protein
MKIFVFTSVILTTLIYSCSNDSKENNEKHGDKGGMVTIRDTSANSNVCFSDFDLFHFDPIINPNNEINTAKVCTDYSNDTINLLIKRVFSNGGEFIPEIDIKIINKGDYRFSSNEIIDGYEAPYIYNRYFFKDKIVGIDLDTYDSTILKFVIMYSNNKVMRLSITELTLDEAEKLAFQFKDKDVPLINIKKKFGSRIEGYSIFDYTILDDKIKADAIFSQYDMNSGQERKKVIFQEFNKFIQDKNHFSFFWDIFYAEL